MSEYSIFCLGCKSNLGEQNYMELKDNRWVCPKCRNNYINGGDEVLKYLETAWKENSNEALYKIRPELTPHDLANPRLYSLYMDCYHTLLIGRYNAAIVMMGVLVEAIAKQCLRLKFNKEFDDIALGKCIKKIEENKLMKREDIQFMRNFAKVVRNRYQHVNHAKIVEHIQTPYWEIKFKSEDISGEVSETLEKIEQGSILPSFKSAADPALNPIIKEKYDEAIIFDLFNEIHDFLVICNDRYFNKQKWDEFHKKYSN